MPIGTVCRDNNKGVGLNVCWHAQHIACMVTQKSRLMTGHRVQQDLQAIRDYATKNTTTLPAVSRVTRSEINIQPVCLSVCLCVVLSLCLCISDRRCHQSVEAR